MGKTICISVNDQLMSIGFCKNDYICPKHPIMNNYSVNYKTEVSCFNCEYLIENIELTK